MTRHRFDCPCATCELKAELVRFKMAWCWAMRWRLDWREVAMPHLELVEAIGPDAQGGRA